MMHELWHVLGMILTHTQDVWEEKKLEITSQSSKDHSVTDNSQVITLKKIHIGYKISFYILMTDIQLTFSPFTASENSSRLGKIRNQSAFIVIHFKLICFPIISIQTNQLPHYLTSNQSAST